MYIIEKLKSKEGLTFTESILADYLLEHVGSTKNTTLQKLADAAYVSKPTAIRLYKKLGFSNYKEFSIALQLEEIKREDSVEIDPNFPFAVADSEFKIAENMGKVVKQVVDSCLASFDEFNMKNIVGVLCRSERIFIFGTGNCYIEAQIFLNRMKRLNKYPILINEFQYPYANIFNLTERDCVIIISSTGKTLRLEKDIIRLLQQSKAKTILMTSEKDFKYRKEFDYVLSIQNGEDATSKNDTLASQISIIFTFNVLYGCMFRRNYEANSLYNKRYSEFVKNYNIR